MPLPSLTHPRWQCTLHTHKAVHNPASIMWTMCPLFTAHYYYFYVDLSHSSKHSFPSLSSYSSTHSAPLTDTMLRVQKNQMSHECRQVVCSCFTCFITFKPLRPLRMRKATKSSNVFPKDLLNRWFFSLSVFCLAWRMGIVATSWFTRRNILVWHTHVCWACMHMHSTSANMTWLSSSLCSHRVNSCCLHALPQPSNQLTRTLLRFHFHWRCSSWMLTSGAWVVEADC